MFFSSWLRNWHRSAPAPRRRPPTSAQRRSSIRPQLEALEDRLVPSGYAQINLVGVQAGMALSTDSNLNGWGMTSLPANVQVPGEGNIPKGSFCVANTFTNGLATFYDRTGHVLSETINVPSSSVSTLFGDPGSSGHPTGVVYNPTSDFVIREGDKSAPATLIFDSIDGTISGWNPEVDATNAIVIRDTWADGNPAANGNPSIYTGLEMAQDGQGDTVLYAADFYNNQVEMINGSFQTFKTFTDSSVTNILQGGSDNIWSVQDVNDTLYVTFANPLSSGPFGGVVDKFDTDGNLLTPDHFAANAPGDGPLENPWGVTQAPANFGAYSNDLLIGNVAGAGNINVYDPKTGAYLGQMQHPDGTPIAIEGLWDLEFEDGPHLYFDAGPDHPGDSEGGLFGVIQAAGDQESDALTSPLLASSEQLGAAQAAAWEQALYALAQAQSGKKN